MKENKYIEEEYYSRQRKILISPFIVYVILTFMIYVLPYAKVTIPYIVSGSLMLAFFPIVMFQKREWMNYAILLLAVSFVIFLLDILIGGYSFIDSLNEMIRNIRFFMPVLWIVYAFEYWDDKRYLMHFLICFFSVVSIMLFKTINALSKDQWVARLLAQDKMQDSPELRAYRLQNVGGFEFAYMMGVVTLILVWAAMNTNNKLVRIIFIGATILSYYYIIQTMYTTLLLLTSIGVLLLLVCSIRNPLVKLMVIIIFIILAFGLAPFFEFLSEFFADSLLSSKFMQIHDALSGEGVEALGSRPQLMTEALVNWAHSPILGGYNVGNKNHSTIVGSLEKNGLVGLIFYITMIYVSWKMVTEDIEKKGYDKLLFNIVCLYLVVLSFFNPIGYIFELTIATFFVTPLWVTVVGNVQDIENKKYYNN